MKTIFCQTLGSTDASPVGGWGTGAAMFPGQGAAFFDGWAPKRADLTAFVCHIIHTELSCQGSSQGDPRATPKCPQFPSLVPSLWMVSSWQLLHGMWSPACSGVPRWHFLQDRVLILHQPSRSQSHGISPSKVPRHP